MIDPEEWCSEEWRADTLRVSDVQSPAFKAKLRAGHIPAVLSITCTGADFAEADEHAFLEILQRFGQGKIADIIVVDLRVVGEIPSGAVHRLVAWCSSNADALTKRQLSLVVRVQSNLWSRTVMHLANLLVSIVPSSWPILFCHQLKSAEVFFAYTASDNSPGDLLTAPSDVSSFISCASFDRGDEPLFCDMRVLGSLDSSMEHRLYVDMLELDGDAAMFEQAGAAEAHDALLLHLINSVVGVMTSPPAMQSAKELPASTFSRTAQEWAVRSVVQQYVATRRVVPSSVCSLPWLGVPYKLKVHSGLSPLQWLNQLTQRLLVLSTLIFTPDGRFRRPGEAHDMFPMGGIELRWRWDAAASRLFINFIKNGQLLSWRWDELIPQSPIAGDTAPDWEGVGHVGTLSFRYSLSSSDKNIVPMAAQTIAHEPQPNEIGSFLSCYGDELELSLALNTSAVRTVSFRAAPGTVAKRKRSRQNSNCICEYQWLGQLLQSIINGQDTASMQNPVPLFVVAGSCPNRFCGMQAVLFCQVDTGVDFWWIKPSVYDLATLEPGTLTKNQDGPHKNVADKSKKLYQPFADKFKGTTDGDFKFFVDRSGRAVIEDSSDGTVRTIFVYFVWQECWSGLLARSAYIEGKICYLEPERASDVSAKGQLFSRQYKIAEGRMWIATWQNEEVIAFVIPPESFQEMDEAPAAV